MLNNTVNRILCSTYIQKKTIRYTLIAGVAVLILFLASCLETEIQVRGYASAGDYKSLGDIITSPNKGAYIKKRAVPHLINMDNKEIPGYVESLLVNNDLPKEIERLMWKNMAEKKLILPSKMTILANKVFYGTDMIGQYYSTVMPPGEINSSMKKIIANLAHKDNIGDLSIFMTNTEEIINTLPEQDKNLYVGITSAINGWKSADAEKQGMVSQISMLQQQIDGIQDTINQKLRIIHSTIMAGYGIQHPLPNYADENTRYIYNQNMNQVNSILRQMSSMSAEGDPEKIAINYLNIGKQLGNPDINQDLFKLSVEIADQVNQRKAAWKEQNDIRSEHNIDKLDLTIANYKNQIIIATDINETLDSNVIERTGKLNLVAEYSYSKQDVSFDVDFFGNGSISTVEISNGGTVKSNGMMVKSSKVVIKNNGVVVNSFNVIGEMGKCYLAYLRDSKKPELIVISYGGPKAFLEDFDIIGDNSDGTVGVLADSNVINNKEVKPNAKVSLDSRALIISYSTKSIKISWDSALHKFVASTV